MPRRADPGVVLPGLDVVTPRGDRVAADWRETVMGRVEAKARVRAGRNGHIRGARLYLNVGLGFNEALGRAAKARGISRVGYLRRAVGAFLAADLGEDFAELMAQCPAPTPFTRERAWVTYGGDDDGSGYGTWVVPDGQTEPAGPARPADPLRGV
jgi:hypothetical protein